MNLSLDREQQRGTWTVDGDAVPVDANEPFGLVRYDGNWIDTHDPDRAAVKWPWRSGPLKRAFDRGFVLVHASHGKPAENELSYERARMDAATWWYRANGHVEVVSDDELLADLARFKGNVILYGNEQTNAAWPALVDAACPIHATRGKLTLGEKSFEGDALAAAFVRPRAGNDAVVALFADTGLAGARVGFTLAHFISGVGYPDYTLFSSDVAAKGDGGVLAAGWFAHDWTLPSK
jgi:hypothetical protein